MVNHFARDGKGSGLLLWSQAGLVAVALLVSLLLPTPDRAGVLIPFSPTRPAQPGNWAVNHGARILQRGNPTDSIVILVPSARIAWDALLEGMIILPASSVGCAGSSSQAGSKTWKN
jgi:hypothetical protein